jgi:hypothetical protein
LERLALLLPELPDQCAIAAEHTHGSAQGDVAERTFLGEVGAEIKVEPCEPPDCRTGYQRAISHNFVGFWHPWVLRRIVSAVGSIRCIRLVGPIHMTCQYKDIRAFMEFLQYCVR